MKKTLTMFIVFLMLIHISYAQEGILNVTGDVILAPTITYEVQLKSTLGAGTGNDQIDATGNVTINGTLNIVLNGYTPTNVDQFEIIKTGGTQSGTFSTINWPSSMNTWMIDYGVLNPGFVTLYASNSLLPVDLMSFTVNHANGNHILRWQTASEINSDYFTIEHSTNGRIFTVIGQKNAEGNSHTIQTYDFTYYYPKNGTNFYRLNQIDKDGKSEYSKIISLKESSLEKLSLYPNPTSGMLYFSHAVHEVVIYDMTGKEIIHTDSKVESINLSQLKTGSYEVEINQGAARQTIIVNK